MRVKWDIRKQIQRLVLLCDGQDTFFTQRIQRRLGDAHLVQLMGSHRTGTQSFHRRLLPGSRLRLLRQLPHERINPLGGAAEAALHDGLSVHNARPVLRTVRDYGFDRFALLFLAYEDNILYVYREFCRSGLTLTQAAEEFARLCGDDRRRGCDIVYAVASPDLWNRRQDSGYSGFEIMSRVAGLPPLIRADNRRIPGWRAVRELLTSPDGEGCRLRIFRGCTELIGSMEALLYDPASPEDASGEPHEVTHAPEALRYAVMSRGEDRSETSVTSTADRSFIRF